MKLLHKAVASSLAVMLALAGPAMAAQHGAKIFVVGGKPSDPFWSKVKRGAEDAGLVVKSEGGSVTWLGPQTYDNLGPDAAKLIRTALSQNPSAIVAPDWVPEAEDSALEAVTAAHVPLIIYNSGGMQAAQRVGAINYIGNDEYIAGVAGGTYFAAHGVKWVVCVNTLPGAANTEARCKGVAAGLAKDGDKSTELPLPSTSFGDPTAVSQAIKAFLLTHRDVDGVMTIGAPDTPSAEQAIMQAGDQSQVKLASFDLDTTVLQNIKSGEQLFAIDQQPYLQGFLSVALINALVNYGLSLPAHPLLTGPGIVNSTNVDAALAGAEAGVR
jgi:simple sugar transport system substrate-binding protein